MSCTLRQGWYCYFKNNASDILLLQVLLLYPMFKILKCLIFSVFNLETFMKPLVQFYKSENHSWRNVTLKLQPEACNFTKSNTPPWVFFTFFKLYKLYQMVQSIKNMRFWQLLKIKNQVENCHQEIIDSWLH